MIDATSTMAAALRADLESLMRECQHAGWDGYGAEAVTPDACNAAERFIFSLPNDIPEPEISADPDGHVTFEWRRSAGQTVLVSVRPGGGLDYAALLGVAHAHGSEPFDDEFPDTLTAYIHRAMGE